ncbi:hypothetical protein B0H67DRAFT_270410 [Lasiosphaeris hirsuta]|uniref:Uncharacterized protein n=1 Tax=Lasiosphaeris hirsuta TaxID=260670 RepID=A0AA40DT38_9PEZI|nr:hypothetical protein B0H67DRAFT_270410 [Lasiosphaeris hirsuta]
MPVLSLQANRVGGVYLHMLQQRRMSMIRWSSARASGLELHWILQCLRLGNEAFHVPVDHWYCHLPAGRDLVTATTSKCSLPWKDVTAKRPECQNAPLAACTGLLPQLCSRAGFRAALSFLSHMT